MTQLKMQRLEKCVIPLYVWKNNFSLLKLGEEVWSTSKSVQEVLLVNIDYGSVSRFLISPYIRFHFMAQ